MRLLVEPVVGVQWLALVTTVHIALAALRNQRRCGGGIVNALTVVSGLLAALPWLFPSVGGLIFGLVIHIAWFGACERWGSRQPMAVQPPVNAPRADSSRAPEASGRSARASTTRPKGFVATPVLTVIQETTDIRTFRIARPDGFVFDAGQFLTLRLRIDGQEHVRCYSISSPPEASGYLEISVKRQGVVSNALHATLRPGSLLSVRAPAGSFVYPATDDRPVVLVGGGVGITPLMSMLRHGVLAEPNRPISLLYSARTPADLAFRPELEWLATRSPRLRVTLAVSGAPSAPDIYPGRIDGPLLRTVPDLTEAIALICGPQPMIEAMASLLADIGVPRPQIRFELFEAAVAASTRASDGERHMEKRSATGETFKVSASRSGRETKITAGQTLLEAAEQSGIDIPSICRAGVCGTCRTRVTEGRVECASGVLDDDDRSSGYVLACVSTALSDCEIEA
jgi:ferredoxin-NADP reductase